MPGKTGKRAKPPTPCARCGKKLAGDPRGFFREKSGDYCEACWWDKRNADKAKAGKTWREMTDDKVYGVKFVYCGQHLRIHETGWCTVNVVDKVPLLSQTSEEAAKEWELKKLWLKHEFER